MKKVDIAVIGAGPAGLQAAISLAEKGYAPLVFEEDPIIGQPIQCGEGISENGLKDFSIPISSSSICVRKLESCRLFFASDHEVLGDITAYTINRDFFDQYLANKAIDLGATILTSSKVEKVSRKKNSLLIKVKDKVNSEYECKLLIIAEGCVAKIAQSLNFSAPTPLIRAFEYKIKGEWTDKLEFYFDSKKYPSGYCWIFPKEDESNIGIVTYAKERKKRLDKFLKEKKIPAEILGKIGGSIPMHGPVKKLHDNRIMLVGDVAGMVNPVFYGGIRIAMTSGKVAGEIAAKYLKDNRITSLLEYEQKLSEYSFMDKVNLECHNFFYSRSNRFLQNLGKLLEGRYINLIKGWEKIEVLSRLLKYPILYKRIIKLYKMYKGFKIVRDWGF
ncbi:MAG: NAD(P)/FAD-dependent oxidoreductase [Candidatus Thorarchaeota archaeon]